MPSILKFPWREFCRAEMKNMLKIVVPPILVIAFMVALLYCTNNFLDNPLNARKWPTLKDDNSGQYVYQILLLSVVALIALNTVAYAFDNIEQARAGRVKKSGGAYLVMFLVIICIFATMFWGFELIWGVMGLSGHMHEVIAMVIFAVFAIIDYSLYRDAHALALMGEQSGQPADPESKLRAQNFLFQLIFVDLPVVLGIIAVLLLLVLIENSPALGSDSGARAYLRGFATGAVVMHMAASQTIFLLIYCHYYYVKFGALGEWRKAG